MPLDKPVGSLDSLTFRFRLFFSTRLEILLELPKTDFIRGPIVGP